MSDVNPSIETLIAIQRNSDERFIALSEEIKTISKDHAKAAGEMALSFSELTAKLGSIEDRHANAIELIKDLKVEVVQKNSKIDAEIQEITNNLHDQDKRVSMLVSVNGFLGKVGVGIFIALVAGLFSNWQVSNRALDEMRAHYQIQKQQPQGEKK